MQLTYLHIHNFKSIRDMEIRDIDRALILVGKNNTGKTSILDAVCAVCGCYQVQENKDGKVRYEDISRKNNPYIPMILPRIYRITADRDLRQLQNDLLMFQEDRQLRKLRSGSCIFDPAKACSHCFRCMPGSWNIRSIS